MGERLLSSGTVCQLLGVSQPTLNDWAKAGIVRPTAGGDGKGSHRLFDIGELLCIATAKALSDSGRSLAVCQRALTALREFSGAELRRMIQRGRSHLLICGDSFAAVQTPADIRTALTCQRAIVESDRFAGLYLVIDLRAILNSIEAAIDALEPQQVDAPRRGRKVRV